jgi:hypothetical protein
VFLTLVQIFAMTRHAGMDVPLYYTSKVAIVNPAHSSAGVQHAYTSIELALEPVTFPSNIMSSDLASTYSASAAAFEAVRVMKDEFSQFIINAVRGTDIPWRAVLVPVPKPNGWGVSRLKNVLKIDYRLHFLCCGNQKTGQGVHLVHHPGYSVRKPREWLCSAAGSAATGLRMTGFLAAVLSSVFGTAEVGRVMRVRPLPSQCAW